MNFIPLKKKVLIELELKQDNNVIIKSFMSNSLKKAKVIKLNENNKNLEFKEGDNVLVSLFSAIRLDENKFLIDDKDIIAIIGGKNE